MHQIAWKSWISAARFKTLPAAVAPVSAGCALAWKLEERFDLKLAVVTLLGALFIQIATNFFNDVIDADKGADTEARLGPQRVTSSGMISRRNVLLGAFLMLALASICGVYLFSQVGWVILLIGIPSLYLSYGYTGGPFPLAYLGLGEIFVILFFGLIAVGGTVYVQLGSWPKEAVLLGLQVGLLSAVLIAVNNYRDLEEDRAANKRTIVVRFGRPFVSRLILLMTIAPYVLIGLFPGAGDWFRWSIVPGVIFVGIMIQGISKARKTGQVHPSLLGLSALHLIVFVFVQTIVMT